jgi:hypothetical protein
MFLGTLDSNSEASHGTEDNEANEVFSSFPLCASVEFLEGEAEGVL